MQNTILNEFQDEKNLADRVDKHHLKSYIYRQKGKL